MTGIFINYRKDDSSEVAAVDLALANRFGPDRVFRDIESLTVAQQYPEGIRQRLEDAGALVVLIGPEWAALEDDEGRPRIFNSRDWVRREIARALVRRIPILPVLVHPLDGPPVKAPSEKDVPEDIRAFTLNQAYAIHRDRMRDDVGRLADVLAQLVPGLLIGDLFTPPPPPVEPMNAPSTRLRPEYEVVSFRPREELGRLLVWARSAAPTSVGLLTGSPGAGRTRLAQELCGRLVGEGWLAGLLRAGPSADQLRHTAKIDQPLLIAIDDAELRPDEVDAVATAFGSRSGQAQAPARLLLVSGLAQDWLAPLRKHPESRVRLLFPEDGGEAVELPAYPPDRAGHVAAAWTAFGSGTTPADLLVPDGSLLEVHAAVLDRALCSPATTRSAGERSLAALVRHDRQHWCDLVLVAGDRAASEEALATIATVAALCRAASAEEAATLADRLAVLNGDGISARSYVDWLSRLFPGPYPLGAVRPDLLAEEIIAASLAADPDLLVLLPRLATDGQLTRAMVVLGRAIPRFPALAGAVTALAGTDLDRLLELGLDATGAIPDSVAYQHALGQALLDGSPSQDLAFRLFSRFPNHLEELSPFIGIAFRVWVDVFPKEIQRQMRAHVGRPDDPGLQKMEEIADKLTESLLGVIVRIIDPRSGALPKRPDGEPVVPDFMLDVFRNIAVYKNKWMGPPKE